MVGGRRPVSVQVCGTSSFSGSLQSEVILEGCTFCTLFINGNLFHVCFIYVLFIVPPKHDLYTNALTGGGNELSLHMAQVHGVINCVVRCSCTVCIGEHFVGFILSYSG